MADNRLNSTSVDNLPTETQPLRAWLESQAETYKFEWLLAHSEDGVNWGKFEENKLIISHDIASHLAFVPELKPETLQQLRLFGKDAELFIWRNHEGLTGRLLRDNAVDAAIKTRNEKHLLWGAQTDDELNQGFIVTSEADGLRQVVPWSTQETRPGPREEPTHRLHLMVRHYIDFDEDGQAMVVASRLVELNSQDRRKEAR